MTAYIFLAQGFEDIEAIATIDILRRSSIKVTTVSITSHESVTSAHGITIEADDIIAHIAPTADDILILPGGMPGTTNLAACPALCHMLTEHNKAQGLIGAICAAPSVLGQLGILASHQATCYPGFEEQLGCHYLERQTSVVSGNIITSSGPGQALNFAYAIVEKIQGKQQVDTLKEQMIVL